MAIPAHFPAFGVCGWSGSGKTTVVEQVACLLVRRGLKVGVVKHDVHGLNIDQEGKDTDRFFNAGADVLVRGPEQAFFRVHRTGDDMPLDAVLRATCPYFDIILAEGHKTTPLPYKVWLLADKDDHCPPEATNIGRVLGRAEDRVAAVMQMIEEWLPVVCRRTPLRAGVLVGGGSARMGRPKHLMRLGGRTYLDRIVDTLRSEVDEVVLLGAGDVTDGCSGLPRLADVPGVRGPKAGMLAAMRWSPLSSWLFVACDLPLVSPEALRWLLSNRKAGVWAVLPRLGPSQQYVEPLLAHYDFRARCLLEGADRPAEIAHSPNVSTPLVPDGIAPAWTNVNTPEDVVRASDLCGFGGDTSSPPSSWAARCLRVRHEQVDSPTGATVGSRRPVERVGSQG